MRIKADFVMFTRFFLQSFFSPLCLSGNTFFLLFVHYVYQYVCLTIGQKQSPTDSAINLCNYFPYRQFFAFSPPIITLCKAGTLTTTCNSSLCNSHAEVNADTSQGVQNLRLCHKKKQRTGVAHRWECMSI